METSRSEVIQIHKLTRWRVFRTYMPIIFDAFERVKHSFKVNFSIETGFMARGSLSHLNMAYNGEIKILYIINEKLSIRKIIIAMYSRPFFEAWGFLLYFNSLWLHIETLLSQHYNGITIYCSQYNVPQGFKTKHKRRNLKKLNVYSTVLRYSHFSKYGQRRCQQT